MPVRSLSSAVPAPIIPLLVIKALGAARHAQVASEAEPGHHREVARSDALEARLHTASERRWQAPVQSFADIVALAEIARIGCNNGAPGPILLAGSDDFAQAALIRLANAVLELAV